MPAPTLVAGAPCWIDLYSSDTAKAADFYGRLFGWTTHDPGSDYGGYFIFHRDGKAVAGCMANDGEQGAPDMWTIYLTTDDADRTVADAKTKGAQVYVEPMDVTQNGRMAMIADPGEAAIGIWQPVDVTGFDVRNEIDTASWFELHTRAYDASVAFYRDVFGWDTHTVSDVPEFRYTTQGKDADALAGIMDATAYTAAGEPAAWTVYFEVEDIDAMLEQIAALGGKVERETEDTPYGKLAAATDPTGTRFKLRQG